MSRFNAEARERILREAYATLERDDEPAEISEPPPAPTLAEIMAQLCETRNDRDRRAERDARWAREKRRREVTLTEAGANVPPAKLS